MRLSIWLSLLLILTSPVFADCPCGPKCPKDCVCGCREEGGKCLCGTPGHPSCVKNSVNSQSQCGCGPNCPKECACGCKEGPCLCGTPGHASCVSTIQYAQEDYSSDWGILNDDDIQYSSESDSAYWNGCEWWWEEDGYIYIQNCIYECLNPCGKRGVWFPEAPLLFKPFIADPREQCASAALRFNDRAIDKHVAAVSYADTIPIYRWFGIGKPCGQLELDIDGALWAIFEPFLYSAPLVDADYFIGFTLSYALEDWSFRLRGYHISTHIGDEFLLNHPHFVRLNPSSEYIDLYASYQWNDDLRLYAGIGVIPFSDDSFKYKPLYFELGAELYLPWFQYISMCNMLLMRPFFAMDFRIRQDNRYNLDSTFAIGYEFAKLSGLERKFRIFAEFHDGYSVDGQFCRLRTNYYSVGITYGY